MYYAIGYSQMNMRLMLFLIEFLVSHIGPSMGEWQYVNKISPGLLLFIRLCRRCGLAGWLVGPTVTYRMAIKKYYIAAIASNAVVEIQIFAHKTASDMDSETKRPSILVLCCFFFSSIMLIPTRTQSILCCANKFTSKAGE